MGWDLKRFRSGSLLREIPRLFCSVCQLVLKEPTVVATCGHTFCKDCVHSLVRSRRNCPEDGEIINLHKLKDGPENVLQMLVDLEMRCDFSSLGCKDFVRMKDLSNHCKGCPFSPNALLKEQEKCAACLKRKQVDTGSSAYHLISLLEEKQRMIDAIVDTETSEAKKAIHEAIAVEIRANDKIKELYQRVAHNIQEDGGRLEQVATVAKRPSLPVVATLPPLPQPTIVPFVTTVAANYDSHRVENRPEKVAANANVNVALGDDNSTENRRTSTRLTLLKENGTEGVDYFEDEQEEDDDDHDYDIMPEVDDDTVLSNGDNDHGETFADAIKRTLMVEQNGDSDHMVNSLNPSRGSFAVVSTANGCSQNSFQDILSSVCDRSTAGASQLIPDPEDPEVQWEKKVVKIRGVDAAFLVKRLNLPCLICKKTFNRKSHFLAHHPCYFTERGITDKEKMAKLRHFDCQFCPKKNKELPHLRKHLVLHCEENSYKCTLCDKMYSREDSVVSHFMIHIGARPYECDQCGKSFVRRCNLQEHILMHKGIVRGSKPKHCQWEGCGKKFSTTARLKEHMMRHRKEKNIKCHFDGCDKLFVTTYEVKRHYKRHHEEHSDSD